MSRAPAPRDQAAADPGRGPPGRPESRTLSLHLADETATARLGAALAGCLGPGDTVLLAGPLGAGKSALARAVIQALLGDPEAEVPSPSYTLVNVYETPRGAVWHADLYRLGGGADEIEETGLAEAMAAGRALVLVEWPGRLGPAVPERRLEIALSAPAAGGRDAAVTARGAGWERMMALLEGWR